MGKPKLDLNFALEIAHALKREDPSFFDRSIGKSDNCLSPRRIVHLLRSGAVDEDRSHLLECLVCQDNVTRLAEVQLESAPGFVAQALLAAKAASLPAPLEKSAGQKGVAPPLRAVVGLPSRTLRIPNTKTREVILSCELFPGFSREVLKTIDLDSVRVDGAVVGRMVRKEAAAAPEAGTRSFLTWTFNGKVAKRVRDSVIRNQRATDTIRLQGRSRDAKHTFLGEAWLEFVP
jgi:hypothetical protein